MFLKLDICLSNLVNQGNSDCFNRVVETEQASVTCTVDVL